ncbi:transcriptional regulator CynR [Streptomyces sp. NBC_01728]|uniref:transcriptional regulator CynR n=1 Tax=unclassified Streptomyces TaxID=2593676 RepID=UPI002250F7D2|nr:MULTISPECIES: transcriptional regulator CynR [unclassified Streptomyces]MCX4461552.1 transcriptional regulator CynR [Streptomyces sp. NBC_01719]MCX4490459.1 transcriptional regulator CynR [Streptomyces sp. NBC_01728]
MGFELRHLRYLLAVAEQGSFTRAAEVLHISQPTLSQQIRQMERLMGTQLLDRTGRAVRLTDAGETYVHYARRALQELAAAERAVHDVADLSRGSLRLAVTPTFTAYLVGPLTGQFHVRHPDISLSIREMTQDRIESALLADDLDLGIAFRGAHLPGITTDDLFTEALSLVVGTDHPYADRTDPLPVRELEGRPLALLSSDFATRRHIDTYFDQHRTTPRIAMEANSVNAVAEMIQRTPLASVLPEAIARDHPHLRAVPLAPPLPERIVTLLCRSGSYQSAAARAFTHLTRQWVASSGYSSSP